MKKLNATGLAIGCLILTNAITGACLVVRQMPWSRHVAGVAQMPGGQAQEITATRKHGFVQEASLNQNSELQACYESFLSREPKTDEGLVEVHWVLEKSGKISEPKVVHSDFDDQTLNYCLLEKLNKMTFHAPDKMMLVAHKFNFRRRAPASVDFK